MPGIAESGGVVGVASKAGGDIITGGLQGAASAGIASEFAPWTEAVNQANWHKTPIILPPIGALIDLANRQYISPGRMSKMLRLQGIWIAPDQGQPEDPGFGVTIPPNIADMVRSGWNAVRKAARPRPDISELLNLYWTGRRDWNQLVEGMRGLGCDMDEWLYASNLGWWYPTIQETIQLSLRDVINPVTRQAILARNRVNNDHACGADDWIKAFERELGSPADHIQFSVSDAWDKSIVQALSLDAEFPPEFQAFMKKLGLAWPISEEPGLAGLDPQTTIALLHWRAHWKKLAPEQIYEIDALYREGNWRGLSMPAGLTTDKLLKQADYPLGARALIQTRAKRYPPREDIVQMLAYSTIDLEPGKGREANAKDLLLDQNYDPKTLPQLLTTIERKATEQRLRNPIGRTVTAILDAYESGAINSDEALELLDPYVHREEEAQWMLAAINLKIETRRLRRIISAIRRSLILGERNQQEAESALLQAGMNGERAAALASEWEFMLHAKWRFTSIFDIRKYLRLGLMSEGDAIFRLRRMRMDDGDISRLVTLAGSQRAADEAREAKRVQREAEQAAERGRKALREALSREKTLYSIARIKVFYEDGVMGESEVREKLQRLHNADTEAQDRLLATWKAPGQTIGVEPP